MFCSGDLLRVRITFPSFHALGFVPLKRMSLNNSSISRHVFVPVCFSMLVVISSGPSALFSFNEFRAASSSAIVISDTTLRDSAFLRGCQGFPQKISRQGMEKGNLSS